MPRKGKTNPVKGPGKMRPVYVKPKKRIEKAKKAPKTIKTPTKPARPKVKPKPRKPQPRKPGGGIKR